MNKKMDIVCHICNRKYINRTSYEKHRDKCREPTTHELLRMIQALTKRVAELEKQTDFEIPEITFQEFLNAKDFPVDEVNMEEKASVIYLEAVRKILGNTDCVKVAKKTFVYEEGGWVKLKDVSPVYIETMVRSIQTKLLTKLPQDENYFKNMTKLTSIDIKKWTKDNLSKI